MFGTGTRGGDGRLGYRAAFLLLLCVVAILPSAARADTSPPAAQLAPVTTDDLERLVDTLQDDAARAKLVAQLRTLLAAQRAAAQKPPATAILGEVSQQIDALTGEILSGVAVIVDAPRLYGWTRRQIADLEARGLWI